MRHNFYVPTSCSIDKDSAASFSVYDEEEVLVEPVCNVNKMEIAQDQYPGELPAGLEGLYTIELRVRPGIRLLLCSCVLMLVMVQRACANLFENQSVMF